MRPLRSIPLVIALALAASGLAACAPTDPACGPAAAADGVVRPEDFGATGDDGTDDTAAMQRALDSLRAGQTLALGSCQKYRHSAVLRATRDDIRITGPGTFLATAERTSSVFVEGDRVRLDGELTFQMESTTKRWSESYDQTKLRITGGTGVVVDEVNVVGSAGAGLFVDHATHFEINDVMVADTRADGVHITGAANHGVVNRPVSIGTGDDGVAVVSYDDEAAVSDVTINSPLVVDQVWGRGVSVVGGDHITYNDVDVRGSAGAAVYLAIEPEFHTHATTDVKVIGGRVERANTEPGIGHGAVVLYSNRPATGGSAARPMSSVEIRGLEIVDTTSTAPCQVSLTGAGPFSGITLTDIAISGLGPDRVLCNGPGAPVTTSGWTVNGTPYG